MKRGVTAGAMVAVLFSIASAWSADHVLVIGGGPTAASSQLSIERNVAFFSQTLEGMGRSDLDPTILFASGTSATPDVCVDATQTAPPIYSLVAQIMGEGKDVNLAYRLHDLAGVEGGTDRANILSVIEDFGHKLKVGDRLVIYVTGHGGKGEPLSNGLLHTWSSGEIRVRDLAEALDRFAPEVEVVVVMVQCYSGSFANLIFEGGDPAKPLAAHRRAGFFATVDSRPAAGCTPDTKIEDYKEYSTSFLAALGGKDRLGQPVSVLDIDEDGAISFAEAHSHTLVHSNTIDICYLSSDKFLETQARLDVKEPKLASGNEPLAELLQFADPVRRATLEQLATELSLDVQSPLADAKEKAKALSEERRKLRRRISKLDSPFKTDAKQIKDALLAQWPALRTPWNPQAHAILRDDADTVTSVIESHSAYDDWSARREETRLLKEEDLSLERRWSKLERFVLVAKSAARAENLRREGSAELLEKFERLLALENIVMSRSSVESKLAN